MDPSVFVGKLGLEKQRPRTGVVPMLSEMVMVLIWGWTILGSHPSCFSQFDGPVATHDLSIQYLPLPVLMKVFPDPTYSLHR